MGNVMHNSTLHVVVWGSRPGKAWGMVPKRRALTCTTAWV